MAKRALLISVRPQFAKLIFARTKSVELRRVRPRIKKGDLVFIYVSSPVMALEGAFEVVDLICAAPSTIWRNFRENTGLTKAQFDDYYKGKQKAFAITIGRVWRLPAPVRLAKLRSKQEGFHPPQNFHYICRQTFSRIAGLENGFRRN